MGCCGSALKKEEAETGLEKRIQAALREIIAAKEEAKETGADDTQASFTRIILKFPILRVSRQAGRRGTARGAGRQTAMQQGTDAAGGCGRSPARQAESGFTTGNPGKRARRQAPGPAAAIRRESQLGSPAITVGSSCRTQQAWFGVWAAAPAAAAPAGCCQSPPPSPLVSARSPASHPPTHSLPSALLPSPLLVQRAIASIRDVFRKFDADNSGTIDRAELKECLKALGAELPDEEIQEMFKVGRVGGGHHHERRLTGTDGPPPSPPLS